jgi:hypothetical protein
MNARMCGPPWPAIYDRDPVLFFDCPLLRPFEDPPLRLDDERPLPEPDARVRLDDEPPFELPDEEPLLAVGDDRLRPPDDDCFFSPPDDDCFFWPRDDDWPPDDD